MLANLILKPAGGSSVFHSNLSLSKLTKQRIEQFPLFYVDAINLLIQFAEVEDLCSNDIISQLNICGTMHVYLDIIHQFMTYTFLPKE